MYKIYSKDNCRYCDMAKSLLNDRGLDYNSILIVESNAGENQITKEDFLTNHPGIRSVPYIIHSDGRIFKTFDELKSSLN